LIVQGALAVWLILLLGPFLNAVLSTAAVVQSFHMATALAVPILRHREPGVERPHCVTGYPFAPLLFAVVCGFLIQSALRHTLAVALVACGLLASGVPLYLWSRRMRNGQ